MSTAVLIRIREVQPLILAHLTKPETGKTFGHLFFACGLKKGARINGISESRILDRALQGLRRHGDIVFENRTWRLANANDA